MFNRRHYDAIANVLAEAGNIEGVDAEAHTYIVSQLVDLFEKDNLNFKPKFFLAAAGVSE